MRLEYFLILLIMAVFVFNLIFKNSFKENMGGYGTVSGLAFNDNAKYCFKNPYDPPDYPGYCSVIGKVVV